MHQDKGLVFKSLKELVDWSNQDSNQDTNQEISHYQPQVVKHTPPHSLIIRRRPHSNFPNCWRSEPYFCTSPLELVRFCVFSVASTNHRDEKRDQKIKSLKINSVWTFPRSRPVREARFTAMWAFLIWTDSDKLPPDFQRAITATPFGPSLLLQIRTTSNATKKRD